MYVSGINANSYTSQLRSSQGNTAKMEIFQSVLENCSQRNQVDISSEDSSLAASMCNIESLLGVSPREDGCIHLEDLQAWYREHSAALGSKITVLLVNCGVDTSQPIDLTTDCQGRIRVANDHPDKEKIEKALSSNAEIHNEYAKVSAMGNFLKGAEEYKDFAEEYERDPQTAMKKHLSVFTGIKKSIVCRLEDGTLNMF